MGIAIAVVGAGAMGSRFGAALHHAGNKVQLVDPWVEHVTTIQQQGGLLVTSETGSELVPLTATLPADSVGPLDLILVFGKATQTASLIESVQHLLADHTVILTLQNGLGNVEALAGSVARAKIVAGVTTIGTELLGPGRIRSLGDGDTWAMQVDGEHGGAIDTVLTAFAASPITVKQSADVNVMIWSKVAFNSVLNTLCTLLQCQVSALPTYPQFRIVAEVIINEIVQVADREDITIDASDIMRTIHGAIDPELSGHHLPSMLQDLLNGRDTEIEHLNGEVVRRGHRQGVPTPYNELIWHLVRMAQATRGQRITALPE
jgi:2-dehydropantoate 2-reductase